MLKAWQRFGCPKGLGVPAPTGKYEVGCVDLMHRLEGDSDGLLVRLFYPTDPGLAGQYQYAKLHSHPQYLKAAIDYMKVMQGREPDTPLKDNGDRGPAFYGAPLISSRLLSSTLAGNNQMLSSSSLPLVVFSHGYSAMRAEYTGLSCDLASHGYVMACVEHRDQSACTSLRKVPKPGSPGEYTDEWIPVLFVGKGRQNREREMPIRMQQVKQRADEVGKALDLLQLLNEGGDVTNMMGERFDWDQFRGRLQLNTAAVMGHSFGGATTLKTLYTDKRFKCGVALDCWMVPVDESELVRIQQPLLFINSDLDFQGPAAVKKMLKAVKPVDKQGISKCSVLTLKGSNHFHQTDFYFTSPTSKLHEIYSCPPLDPIVGHQINSNICIDFLKRFLLKDPAYQQHVPNLDGGHGASEHILFGTNVDCENGVERGDALTAGVVQVPVFYLIFQQVNLQHCMHMTEDNNPKYKLHYNINRASKHVLISLYSNYLCLLYSTTTLSLVYLFHL